MLTLLPLAAGDQAAGGMVLAPVAGRVLDGPVSAGAVVMAGEVLVMPGGGGIFLRNAVPERYASSLKIRDASRIETASGPQQGRQAQIYPQIENGRMAADASFGPDTSDALVVNVTRAPAVTLAVAQRAGANAAVVAEVVLYDIAAQKGRLIPASAAVAIIALVLLVIGWC